MLETLCPVAPVAGATTDLAARPQKIRYTSVFDMESLKLLSLLYSTKVLLHEYLTLK